MVIALETVDIENEKIYQLLSKSQRALSVSEIRIALKASYNESLPDYQITRHLRKRSQEGIYSYLRGKWILSSETYAQRKKTIDNQEGRIIPPALSALGIDALNNSSEKKLLIKKDSTEEEKAEEELQDLDLLKGPWSKFRSLISYYKECIRSEEGAEATAFLDDFGKTYLHYAKSGKWYPKPGLSWKYHVPLGSYLSDFIKTIEQRGEDVVVVLGYPLQAIYIEKEDEPDQAFIRPVFQFQLNVRYDSGALTLSTVDNRPAVNLEWLRYAFQSLSNQKNFLSACGLLGNTNKSDELVDSDIGHEFPRLDTMVTGLSTFLAEKVREPLQINSISPEPLTKPFQTGIYNRAVVMIGKRTRYTKTLINELTKIEQTDDSILERTALKDIFKNPKKQRNEGNTDEMSHESCVIDTDLLNMEQRQAIASLLNHGISLITGPPGTGKSQVVSSAITNLRLKGRTCLFASRNHKAIDAVVNRCTDKEHRSLIIRTNSKDDPSLKYTFKKATRDLLSVNPDLTVKQQLETLQKKIKENLAERGKVAELSYELQSFRDELGDTEEQLTYLEGKLPADLIEDLSASPEHFPTQLVAAANSFFHAANTNKDSSRAKRGVIEIFSFLATKPLTFLLWVRTRKYRDFCSEGLVLMLRNHELAEKYVERLSKSAKYAALKISAISIEQKMKGLPPLDTLSQKIEKLNQSITSDAKEALVLDLDSRKGVSPEHQIRDELASLIVALTSIERGIVTDEQKKESYDVLKRSTPLLLDHFPCWAVTNLSAGSRIPLFPGMYDLAIVDEASQSDIASAIPILFRAKRAAVVGDPQQLTHSSNLTMAKESLLRKSAGLNQFEDLKYSYTETSLYDLFAQTNGVKPIFLSTTYRSEDSIAQYSNTTFYDGRLRVATDHNRLTVPKNLKVGIHWTDISGEIASVGGGGCYCAAEVDAVVDLIKKTIRENNFRGSLGVVTPFRQQANRINDALYASGMTFEELDRAQVHVDTSHGFQGDEKDVIFFSLCAGPDMPSGARVFLRETSNLFNVAVSRARAVFHVFGNRDWSEKCRIQHIQNLTRPIKKSQGNLKKGQWYPHDSPWEKILYEALTAKGLNPIPQYPVSGRRLDMALVGSEKSAVKFDIEVDGDRYHRNRDGSRKIDDVWRDIQLQGMGWKVMRFWVYELREDLDGCVEKILIRWSENDGRDKSE